MSSHKDNTENRPLKDLLNKNIQREEPMDEFEQEALEGFALLENQEEAFDLKNKLDEKIYSEVFTGEDKKSSKNYWYAAAGLFLVIGFSIYFFRTNTLVKEEKLAMQFEHVVKADEIQKSIEAQTEKNKSLEFKSAENPKSTTTKSKWAEEEYSEKDALLEKPLKSTLKKEQQPDVSINESRSEPSIAQAAPMGESRMEDKSFNPVMNADKSSKDEESDLKEEKLARSSSKDDSKPLTLESKKSKVVERKREASPVSSSDSYASPGAGASIPIGVSVADEAALKKELKENLGIKNLLGKFDATLVIDSKGKVDKVIFTNAFDFTKSQQKDISQIIKGLKSLTFTNANPSVLSEYRLVFRP